MRFEVWVERAATAFEAAGVLAMVGGALLATALTITNRAPTLRDRLRDFRQRFGRAIVLGLELLVASDILRTIPHMPTFGQVGVLGVIVLIRTVLSWALEVELEGRWPWKPRPTAPEPPPAPPRPRAGAAAVSPSTAV